MQNQAIQSWVNGQPASSIALADRGLAYGQGVFETLRVSSGEIPLLPWHQERLSLGLAKLGIPFKPQLLQQYLDDALGKINSLQAIIKIIVTAGVGQRGYHAKELEPSYAVQIFNELPLDTKKIEQGVRLHLCDYRLPENRFLAGIKHLNRLDQVMAAAEFDPNHFTDGLMLDNQDSPIETVSRNIFFKTTTGWVTPELDRCGVVGVMRQYLIQQVFPALNINLLQQSSSLQQLQQSSEVFVCNSVTGVWPVVHLAGQADWAVGVDTRKVITQLAERLVCFRV